MSIQTRRICDCCDNVIDADPEVTTINAAEMQYLTVSLSLTVNMINTLYPNDCPVRTLNLDGDFCDIDCVEAYIRRRLTPFFYPASEPDSTDACPHHS